MDAKLIAPPVPETISGIAAQVTGGDQPALAALPHGLRRIVEQWAADVRAETGADHRTVLGLAETVATIFHAQIADAICSDTSPLDASALASRQVIRMLSRVYDHTPHRGLTSSDAAAALLKVDQEDFGGRFRERVTTELVRWGLFNGEMLRDFIEREYSLPTMALTRPVQAATSEDLGELLDANIDCLGLTEPLGLLLQTMRVNDQGQLVARVSLTYRGRLTANHGLVSFRKDGSLMDWQTVLPRGLTAQAACALFHRADELHLWDRGRVELVPLTTGEFSARVTVGGGRAGAPAATYSIDHPYGLFPAPAMASGL